MLMSRVFQVKPKRLKRSNGTVLTPDMVVTVTTMQHAATPFYNGAKEVQEAYMRIYAFDYKKACCKPRMILNLRSWTKNKEYYEH